MSFRSRFILLTFGLKVKQKRNVLATVKLLSRLSKIILSLCNNQMSTEQKNGRALNYIVWVKYHFNSSRI